MPNGVTLFLGAGASKTFGYPTTKDFLVNLNEKLEDEKKDILYSLRRLPNVGDIENILELIDPIVISNSNKLLHESLSKIGTLLPVINKTVSWSNYLKAIVSLKEIIIKDLHEQYKFVPSSINEIVEIYRPLIEYLSILKQRNEEGTRQNIFNVFTTNYDLVFEQYALADEKVVLHDFFEFESNTERYYWSPPIYESFFENSPPMHVRLFKLHGSLNWRETKDGRIEKCSSEEYCSNLQDYKKNVLIYPTQKMGEEEPYKTIFNRFEEVCKSAKLIVVIGCSFRDFGINQVFINYLQSDKINKLLVVSPSGIEDVKNNLLGNPNIKENSKRLIEQINIIDKELNTESRDLILDRSFGGWWWRKI